MNPLHLERCISPAGTLFTGLKNIHCLYVIHISVYKRETVLLFLFLTRECAFVLFCDLCFLCLHALDENIGQQQEQIVKKIYDFFFKTHSHTNLVEQYGLESGLDKWTGVAPCAPSGDESTAAEECHGHLRWIQRMGGSVGHCGMTGKAGHT